MKTNTNTKTLKAAVDDKAQAEAEAQTLNPAAETQAEAEALNPAASPEAETEFAGLALEIKKQLININFKEKDAGVFNVVISHKSNPLLYPDIVIGSANMQQLLAFAANGLNAVLNDNSGSRKPEKWAEIEAYLKYGFLTKSDYLASLPKSKIAAAAQINEWVDEVIVLTINQTKELDQERKSKLISRLYSEDAAIRESAFNIARSWIDVVATVKADYTLKLAIWRQEQAKAAITPLLNAIDTL